MIVYCLLAKEGKVAGEYGTTTKDYSMELLAVIGANTKLGTRFVNVGGLSCAILNKIYWNERFAIAVVVEQVSERDSAFDCLDRIVGDFEKDTASRKSKDCVARIGKHMRAAMVLPFEQGHHQLEAEGQRYQEAQGIIGRNHDHSQRHTQ